MSNDISKLFEVYFQLMRMGRDQRKIDLAKRVLPALPTDAQEAIVGGEALPADVITQLSMSVDETVENCNETIEAFLRWRSRGGLEVQGAEPE